MELYIKIPFTLAEEENKDNIYHYCRIYMTLLSRKRINLSNYCRDNSLSYNIARRLQKLAKSQINGAPNGKS